MGRQTMSRRLTPISYPIPCLVTVKAESMLSCLVGQKSNEDGTFTVLCGMERNRRIFTKKSAMFKAEAVADETIVRIENLQ